MLTRHRLVPLIAAALLLAGCATEALIPEDQIYQPPAAHAGVARIKGSLLPQAGLFSDEHRGCILMIDRRFVRNAVEECLQPVALTPGSHEISAEYRHSVFTSRAVFTLEAQADVTYELRIKPGAEGEDEKRFCDFSIVEAATGKLVTEVKHSYVSGGQVSGRSNFRPLD